MVIFGVFLELLSNTLIFRSTVRLQELDGIAISEATTKAAAANVRAGNAETAAADTAKEAAIIRERAALTEERLLDERRLTANERWRLERLEKIDLPRSQTPLTPAKIAALISDLKGGNFAPLNLAIVDKPEPMQFGLLLMQILKSASLLNRLIILPAGTAEYGVSVYAKGMNQDATRFAELLWQKYQIGGGMVGVIAIGMEAIPPDTNCLIVGENDAAFQGAAGQPGEGVDTHGEPVPALQ